MGTLCELLSLLTPDNKGRVPKPLSGLPGRRREGTKGEGTCPVSAQQRSSILTFSPGARAGRGGSLGIGHGPHALPVQALEDGLMAGVFADGSGRM